MIPNLDNLDIEGLQDFLSSFPVTGHPGIKNARRLCPDRRKGYVGIARDVRAYTWHKITAMKLRLEGSIEVALRYEAICDRMYQHIPEDLRW